MRCVCAILVVAGSAASAKTPICAPGDMPSAPLLLEPYISDSGQLCFDVQNWSSYAGQDCVANGGTIRWQTSATVMNPKVSKRTVWLRVREPVVTSQRLAYAIEFSQDSSRWEVLQRIDIDRSAGMGTSDQVSAHADNPFRCGNVSEQER